MSVRKQYNSIDLTKFICAILIIVLHTDPFSSYSSILHYGVRNIVTTVALPFFFISSGFLFFIKINSLDKNEQSVYFKRYIKRLVIMYVIWSAVYFPFVIFNWFNDGFTYNDVLQYIKDFFFKGSYSTIWFLPALISSSAVVYLLHKKFSFKRIILISLPFYIFACLGSSYYGLTEQIPVLSDIFSAYYSFFDTIKNGLLFGFIFVAIGGAFTEKAFNFKKSNILLCCIVLFILLAFETVIQTIMGWSIRGVDTKLFHVPLGVFMFMYVCSLDLPDSPVYVIMRKLSLLMFLSQRIFITLFDRYLAETIFTTNSMLYFISILVLTMGFSYCFIKLSDKVKLLKYFY